MIDPLKRIKIGDKVRSARNNLGISREKLSELVDMGEPLLGKIERGEARVTVEHIASLSKAFNCSTQDLMS